MSAPIIFIHYGDSYYLKYTLGSAVRSNSGVRVILLGDEHNAHHASLGVEYYPFRDYDRGAAIDVFDRVYQHIAGDQHGREVWTRFVFRRWFLIDNFIRVHDIERFWTFDSDTLILSRLSGHEAKFTGFDCTEQCSAMCMNGYIGSARVVKGYVSKINELFQRGPFIAAQRANLKILPSYAFTEMRAYVHYREEEHIRTTRLSRIIDDETFVDSIVTLDEHRWYLDDDDYEIYERKVWGHDLKKLYLGTDGAIYLRHGSSGRLVKASTINMSWVHEYLFEVLVAHAGLSPGRAPDGGAMVAPVRNGGRGVPRPDVGPGGLAPDVRLLSVEELEAGTHG